MPLNGSDECAQAIILPGNLIYIGISIVGKKIYANSVLAVYVLTLTLSHTLYSLCDPCCLLLTRDTTHQAELPSRPVQPYARRV